MARWPGLTEKAVTRSVSTCGRGRPTGRSQSPARIHPEAARNVEGDLEVARRHLERRHSAHLIDVEMVGQPAIHEVFGFLDLAPRLREMERPPARVDPGVEG